MSAQGYLACAVAELIGYLENVAHGIEPSVAARVALEALELLDPDAQGAQLGEALREPLEREKSEDCGECRHPPILPELRLVDQHEPPKVFTTCEQRSTGQALSEPPDTLNGSEEP